ncbi:hypothetical protein [Cognatilysobacter lacus]|uniref:Uncharacterized protein n=1 Tax=Cognatilysobacter lacus TaxID=1643323 RepID=A0A5D8Z7N2_9GAMM|nr:hypothetical protein [Lysobacter lacus]TZF90132.1 hypothetical protein FW784_06460 [Lysobacter lacus]
MAAAAAAAPVHAAHYPVELRGAWHVGTAPCRLPEAADSDGLITIGRDGIAAYEARTSAYSIRRIASVPPTWRLDELEDYEGETRRFTRTIVLTAGSFTSTEGRQVDTYTRCSGSAPRR